MARNCQCPADGSILCSWCTYLLQRANGVYDPPTALMTEAAARALYKEGYARPYHPYRSKTEWRYAQVLEAQKQQGLVLDWRYEPIRLRLAPATTLTVDFLVEIVSSHDTTLQFHEVKGAFIREKSWVKLKTAAAMYPMFRFFRVQWKDSLWNYLEVPSA